MDFLGSINATSDPPGIDSQKWVDVIAGHPNLVRFEDREELSPFTRAPITYRADPRDARVVVDDAEVGLMSWAQDGSHRIAVFGNPELVEPLAFDVASRLGGVYRKDE